MAFPSDTATAADLAVLIPSVWGERINDFFKDNAIFADFFTDRSSEVAMGGDNLVTPNLTEMSAYSKGAATAVTLDIIGRIRWAVYMVKSNHETLLQNV